MGQTKTRAIAHQLKAIKRGWTKNYLEKAIATITKNIAIVKLAKNLK